MSKPRKALPERIAEAEAKSARWSARADQVAIEGRVQMARQWYAKAARWRDVAGR